MTHALLQYDRARLALARARTVDEVKAIRDQARALREYARQRRDPEMHQWLSEIEVRGGRRWGELSKELPKSPGSRTDKPRPGARTKLKRQAQQDSGLSKTAAHECEQIASIPEAEFEAILAEAREKKRSITGEELIRKVRQRRRHAAARAKHTEAQRQAPEKAILYHTPALSLLETIPERSVDCLLTDPPYSTDVPDVAAFAVEWLPLALARIAPTGRAYVCPRNAGGRIPHHAPGAPVPEGADGG